MVQVTLKKEEQQECKSKKNKEKSFKMTSSQEDMVLPVTDSEQVGMYTHILHKYSNQHPGMDEE